MSGSGQSTAPTTMSVNVAGMDADAKNRLMSAIQGAGGKVDAASDMPVVKPGADGTIETSISLNSKGLDEDGLQKLRAKAYSDESHTRIIQAILQGAISSYGKGLSAGDTFVQWIWCEWLKLLCDEMDMRGDPASETFKKRYVVRPDLSKIAGGTPANW